MFNKLIKLIETIVGNKSVRIESVAVPSESPLALDISVVVDPTDRTIVALTKSEMMVLTDRHEHGMFGLNDLISAITQYASQCTAVPITMSINRGSFDSDGRYICAISIEFRNSNHLSFNRWFKEHYDQVSIVGDVFVAPTN